MGAVGSTTSAKFLGVPYVVYSMVVSAWEYRSDAGDVVQEKIIVF
jgi:hypothetical protein